MNNLIYKAYNFASQIYESRLREPNSPAKCELPLLLGRHLVDRLDQWRSLWLTRRVEKLQSNYQWRERLLWHMSNYVPERANFGLNWKRHALSFIHHSRWRYDTVSLTHNSQNVWFPILLPFKACHRTYLLLEGLRYSSARMKLTAKLARSFSPKLECIVFRRLCS